MIDFCASIHRIAIDAEGEATITLRVPSSDLIKAQSLSALLQRAVAVRVAPMEMTDET